MLSYSSPLAPMEFALPQAPSLIQQGTMSPSLPLQNIFCLWVWNLSQTSSLSSFFSGDSQCTSWPRIFPILNWHANHFLLLPAAGMSLLLLSIEERTCQRLNSPGLSRDQVTRKLSINLDASHSQGIQHGASNCFPVFPPAVWHTHKFRWGKVPIPLYSSPATAPRLPAYLIYQQVFLTLLPKRVLHSSLLAFTTITTRSKLLSLLIWTLQESPNQSSCLYSCSLQGRQGHQPSETASDHAIPCNTRETWV